VLIAEIGVDMSAFPTAKHLASWAGLCPGNNEPVGKRRSGKTRKGSKWLRATLTEAAFAATKTKGSYLAAQYQRLRGRRGHRQAVTAVGHSILTAIRHMLTTGETCRDLGGDYFIRQNPDRTTRRLTRQLEALGHQVTLTPREPEPEEVAAWRDSIQNRWGDSWPPTWRISGRPRGVPAAAYGENPMAIVTTCRSRCACGRGRRG
jgi:hypothetical protein